MTAENYRLLFYRKLTGLYEEREIERFYVIVLNEIFKIPTPKIIANDFHLNDTEQKTLQTIVERLSKFEPIQYIIGYTYFYNCKIFVDKRVLIPRPETEELVEKILKSSDINKDTKIIDIGTGSGAIAIALAKNSKAQVWAIDVSLPALEVAKINAKQNNVKVNFCCCDIFQPILAGLPEKFNIIVSNPPYVLEKQKKLMNANVLNYEPHIALFVPDDAPCLFYEAIVNFSLKYLENNGKIFVEINELMGNRVKYLFDANGFEAKVEKDFFGRDRFVVAYKKGC